MVLFSCFHYDTLLQNSTDIITKCGSYFITKCEKKLITKYDVYYKLRRYRHEKLSKS